MLSAGRAVVDVVPSFKGFVQRARQEFRALDGAIVNVKPDLKGFDSEMAAATRGRDVNVGVTLDRNQLTAIQAAIDSLGGQATITADSSDADRAVNDVRQRLADLRDKVVTLSISDEGAKQELASINRELESIDGTQITATADVDVAAARAELARFDAELSRIDGQKAEAQVSADTGGALAAITAVSSAITALRTMRPVKLDIAGNSFGQATMQAAQLGSTLLGLGAAIPVILGVGGAIASLGPVAAVAGAGLASTLLGFSGVTKAVGALGDAQDSAGQSATDSAKQQRAAAESVAGAQKRVVDATRNLAQVQANARDSAIQSAQAVRNAQENAAEGAKRAARAVTQAVQGQQAAERTLTSAVRDARRAQLALTAARDDARRALLDLSDQLAENALSQQRAVLDLADAQREAAGAASSPEAQKALNARARATIALAEAQAKLSAANSDPATAPADKAKLELDVSEATSALRDVQSQFADTSDEAERARIAYEQQALSLSQLRRQGVQLAAEKAKADRAGVEGSTQVVAAQESLVAANQRVGDAQRGVGEAAQAVSDARADQAAQAIEGQRAIADAVRSQASEQRNTAYSLQSAQEGVAEAQAGVAKALRDAAEASSSASGGVDKLKQAFKDLSPAAAAFAVYLFSLKPKLDELKAAAAEGLFPGLTDGLNAQVAIFPVWKSLISSAASAMGNFFRIVLTGLAAPEWQAFFGLLGSIAGPVMSSVADLFLKLAGFVRNLITAMVPALPALFGLTDAFVNLLNATVPLFAGWGSLIPLATMLVNTALVPIIGVLAQLTPMFGALGQICVPLIGILVNALAPVLLALQPLIVALAQAFSDWLVAALMKVQPYLLWIAQWMSAHPQTVIALGSAILTITEWFRGFLTVLGLLQSLLLIGVINIALNAMGTSFAALGTAIAGMVSTAVPILAPFMTRLTTFFGKLTFFNILGKTFSSLGGGIGTLAGKLLGLLGPVGWLITIFVTLFTTSEQFRGAIFSLVGVLGNLFMGILQAIMPILSAVMGLFGMLVDIFMIIVNTIVAALVPVIMQITGVLNSLIAAVLPPLIALFTAFAPVITLIGQIFVELVKALMPLVTIILQLFTQNMSASIGIVSAIIPLISLLVQLFAGGLGMILQYVVVPALTAVVWAIQQVGRFTQWLASLIVPVLQAIGGFFADTFNNIILPVFHWFIGALERAGIVFSAIFNGLILPLWNIFASLFMIAFNAMIAPVIDRFQRAMAVLGAAFQVVCAFIGWVWDQVTGWIAAKWNEYVKPVIDLFVRNLQILGGAISYLWTTYVQPIFDAIGKFISDKYNEYVKPVFDAFGDAMDAQAKGADRFWSMIRDAFNKIGDVVRSVYDHTLKPIFDAIGKGFEVIGWIFGGDTDMPPPQIQMAQGAPPQAIKADGGVITYRHGGMVGRPWRPFAGGGSTLPGYAPGVDSVPAVLSPGEGVLVPEAVRALGGAAAIDAINARYSGRVAARPALEASSGVAGMGLPGFAHGGVVARFADGGAVMGAAGASSPAGAAAAPTGPVMDPAATQAATEAVTALTAAVVELTAALAALAPVLVTVDLAVTTLTVSTQTLTATALVPLAAELFGVTVPAFQLLELHAGTLAVQAILALAAQIPPLIQWFNLLQQNIYSVWTFIVQTIMWADQSIANRNFQLQQEMSQAWNGIASNVTTNTDTMNRAIDGFIRSLDALRQAEQFTAEWTRGQFDTMRESAAGPIRWIMQFPLGPPGLAASWNSLDDQFKLGKRINPPLPGFATGGLVHGAGTPTSDSIAARLSRGEFVVNAEATRKSLPFLRALNNGEGEALQATGGSRASTGRAPGSRYTNAIGLATGGFIDDRIMSAMKWLSTEARGAPYVYGGGTNPRAGMDCSSMQSAVTHILSGRPPNSGRIGATSTMPWGGFLPGINGAYAIGNKPNDHMAGTLTLGGVGHNVEQHAPGGNPFQFPSRWGADNPYFTQAFHLGEAGGQFVSGGAGGGSFDPTPIVEEKFKRTYELLGDVTKYFPDSPFVTGAQGIAQQAVDGVKGKAMEQLSAMFASSGVMGPLGAGAPFVVEQISNAARMLFGPDAMKAAVIGVATGLVESNLTNIMSAVDHDSLGVFQQRPSQGWGTPEQLTNVLYAATAFFRRFPPGWQGQNGGEVAANVQRPRADLRGKYGTRMGEATSLVQQYGKFDDGGLAYGKGYLAKNTISPERVLSPQQTASFDNLVAILGRNGVAVDSSANAPVEFPSEFVIRSGRLAIEDDGFVRIVDGRLDAVTSSLIDGRQP